MTPPQEDGQIQAQRIAQHDGTIGFILLREQLPTRQRHHRDPESGVITRHFFRPAVERRQSVTLKPGEKCAVAFTLSDADFAP